MDRLTWSTEQRVINELIPYEHNPRALSDREAEQLKASLDKFGLVEIPAINSDNTIIAGHQRLKIMQLLGHGRDTIDVRVPSRLLTPEEFNEYLIRSNKNTGHWDYSVLGNVFDTDDLTLWGFELSELFGTDEDEKGADADRGPSGEKASPDDRFEWECGECGVTQIIVRKDLKKID